MQRALTEGGHRVYEAGNGKEAMALLYILSHPVRLTIIDHRLPDQMGRDLATDIRREGLSKSVLLTSGDPALIRELENNVSREGWSFLPKPFTPQQLVCAVQAILEAASPIDSSALWEEPDRPW
jgi:DNA-binding response OmpR family regulator